MNPILKKFHQLKLRFQQDLWVVKSVLDATKRNINSGRVHTMTSLCREQTRKPCSVISMT